MAGNKYLIVKTADGHSLTFDADGLLEIDGNIIGHATSGFPTFTGSGSPEGVQTATAVNQTYIDSATGDLWLYNGTPPSNTGWVLQSGVGAGGDYASITGPGKTATPGPLTQAGGWVVNAPNTDTVGIQLSDDGSGGITLNETGNAGIHVSDNGAGGVEILANGSGPLVFGSSAGGSSGTARWYFHAGNPNTYVTAAAEGDLCVDRSTPAIWQASAAGNTHWAKVGGTITYRFAKSYGVVSAILGYTFQGFAMPLLGGQTMTFIGVKAYLSSGTATIDVTKNGTTVSGLGAVAVTTTDTTTNATGTISVADGDRFGFVLSSPSGTGDIMVDYIFEETI